MREEDRKNVEEKQESIENLQVAWYVEQINA